MMIMILLTPLCSTRSANIANGERWEAQTQFQIGSHSMQTHEKLEFMLHFEKPSHNTFKVYTSNLIVPPISQQRSQQEAQNVNGENIFVSMSSQHIYYGNDT